jgi:ribose 5-phosphate isomerase
LAGILKELGLWAVPVEVTPKTSEEIAREIAKSENVEGKKVPHF